MSKTIAVLRDLLTNPYADGFTGQEQCDALREAIEVLEALNWCSEEAVVVDFSFDRNDRHPVAVNTNYGARHCGTTLVEAVRAAIGEK